MNWKSWGRPSFFVVCWAWARSPTDGDENVAHALVRAVSALLRTPERRQEWRRGTQECVRHNAAVIFESALVGDDTNRPPAPQVNYPKQ